jgi:hypothetical protein
MNMEMKILLTEKDIDAAVAQLNLSERGRTALQYIHEFLTDGGGTGLDASNKQAVMALLYAAFTDWSGYTLEAIEEVPGI